MDTTPTLPVILSESALSPGQLRYWRSAARHWAGQVDYLDPSRLSLRRLRELLPAGSVVYRASTGGRWGKSHSIVRL